MKCRSAIFVALGSVCLSVAATAIAQVSPGVTPRTQLSYLLEASVQQDLKLTTEQIQKFQEAQRQFTVSRGGDRAPGQQGGRPTSAAQTEAAQAAIQSTLTAEQAHRFGQILLQQQDRTNLTSLFRDQKVLAHLAVSPDQLTQVTGILDDDAKQTEVYRREISDLFRNVGSLSAEERTRKQNDVIAKYQEARRASESKLRNLLTADQQGKYKEMLGEPFRGTLSPRGFGPPNGGNFPGSRYELGTLDSPSLRFVQDPVFHTELKLTPEQARKVAQFPSRGSPESVRLAEILSPEQIRRAHELTLQYAQQSMGKTGPLRYRIVVEAISPSEEQRGQLKSILDERIRPGVEERLAAVLSAEQQTKLKELLGTPFQGNLAPQAFGAGAAGPGGGRGGSLRIGASAAPQTNLLGAANVQSELKLNDEQKRLVSASPNTTALRESLTPEQLKRAVELTYQYGRQSMGPAGPFLYAPLADELTLTDEQRTAVQALLSESAPQFFTTGRGANSTEPAAATRKQLETQVEERLNKILQPGQQAKLTELLGPMFVERLTPFTFASRATFGGRSGDGSAAIILRIAGNTGPLMALLNDTKVQDELKLNDRQKRLAADDRRGDPALRQSLSPEQLKRAQELTVQYGRQTLGPSGAFVFTPLVDDLQLTAEQRGSIQTLLSETAWQFMIWAFRPNTSEQAAAERKELEAQTEEKLNKILQSEQQAKLKERLGVPFAGPMTPASRGDFGGVERRGAAVAPGTPTSGRGTSTFRFQMGLSIAPDVRILREPSFHSDLKLTPEQSRQAAALNTRPTDAELEKMFSSDQLRRARELTLQYYRQVYGPAGMFLFRDAVEAAQLTAEQIAKVHTVFDETRRGFSTRNRIEAAQRAALERAAEERLSAILSAEQLAKLKDALGIPYQGELVRTTTREATSRRNLAIGGRHAPADYFMLEFNAELKTTSEQQQQMSGLRSPGQTARLEAILTPAQVQRARELTLQYARQVGGPASPFSYDVVVNELSLTTEQRAKLQPILDETRPQFQALQQLAATDGATQRSDLNRRTEERIAAILTAEQMNKLEKLFGEKYQGELMPSRSQRDPGRNGSGSTNR